MAYGFGAAVISKPQRPTYSDAVANLLSAIQGEGIRDQEIASQKKAQERAAREARVTGVLDDLKKIPSYKVPEYIAKLPADLQDDLRNHGRGLVAPEMTAEDYAEKSRIEDFTQATRSDPRENASVEANRYRTKFKADMPKEQWTSAMTGNLQGTPGLLEANRIENKQQVTADEGIDNTRADRKLNEIELPESKATIGYTNAGTRERNATTGLRGAETTLANARTGALARTGIDAETGINPGGLVGQAYLNTLPKPTADFLRAIVDLRADPVKFASMRTGERTMLGKMVLQVDPSFDFADYPNRFKLRQQLTSTNSPKLKLNTTIHHVEDLLHSIDAVGNRGSRTWNKITNAASEEFGKGSVRQFGIDATAVASEAAKFFKGTASPSTTEIDEWLHNLQLNDSPEQQRTAAREIVKLLGGQLSALGTMMERAKLPKDEPLLDNKSRNVLKKLGVDPDEFEKAAGMDTSSVPSGASSAAPGGGNLLSDPNEIVRRLNGGK